MVLALDVRVVVLDEFIGSRKIEIYQIFVDLEATGILPLLEVENSEAEHDFPIIRAELQDIFELLNLFGEHFEIVVARSKLSQDPGIIRSVVVHDFILLNCFERGCVEFLLHSPLSI